MRHLALALVVFCCVMQIASALPPRVQIVRASSVTWDDEAVVLQIRVEPDSKNRALVVAAVDGDLVVRQSTEQLDGETAMRTRWLTWWRLPAGDLILVASLFDASGKQVARDTWPVMVLSRR